MTNIDLAYRVGTTSNRIATNEMRLNEERIRLEKEKKFLKERNSKAIEYIESYMPNYDFDKTNLTKVLDILKGVDKE